MVIVWPEINVLPFNMQKIVKKIYSYLFSLSRNGRLQYAQELAKYIGVDIYGACGSLR